MDDKVAMISFSYTLLQHFLPHGTRILRVVDTSFEDYKSFRVMIGHDAFPNVRPRDRIPFVDVILERGKEPRFDGWAGEAHGGRR